MGIGACALWLLPLLCVDQPWAGAVFLVLSPLCSYTILSYHYAHPRLRLYIPMSMLSFMVASVGAVSTLSCINLSFLLFPCVSTSMSMGVVVMLTTMNTHDIANVMACTACGVWVFVLSCTPAVTSAPIAYHCYRCASLPILFMFWRCTTPQRVPDTEPTHVV